MTRRFYRVGVLFGGRSSEHEVSLASARNVMDALREAGHEVVPIGITTEGRWLVQPDALERLTGGAGQLEDADAGEVTEGGGSRRVFTRPTGEPGQSETGGAGRTGDADAGQLELGGERSRRVFTRPTGEMGWGLLPEIDVVFPVLHGPYGEDGTVQGLLEMANLPYVGSGVLASACGMDKIVARRLFAQAGLPQVQYTTLSRRGWREDRKGCLLAVEGTLGYPVFVKPANLGSSVGISKARDREQLAAALDLAAQYDRRLLIEAAVPQARELEVSVLGNDQPVASVPGEIVPGNEFYDYDAKYVDDNSELLIPAPLEADVVRVLQKLAVRSFVTLDCAGLARVDFLMDGTSGEILVNEVNTMPGFTRISMYPKLWEASGMGYPELVDRLVRLALERHADRQENSTAH